MPWSGLWVICRAREQGEYVNHIDANVRSNAEFYRPRSTLHHRQLQSEVELLSTVGSQPQPSQSRYSCGRLIRNSLKVKEGANSLHEKLHFRHDFQRIWENGSEFHNTLPVSKINGRFQYILLQQICQMTSTARQINYIERNFHFGNVHCLRFSLFMAIVRRKK